jgi:hypothetical protein
MLIKPLRYIQISHMPNPLPGQLKLNGPVIAYALNMTHDQALDYMSRCPNSSYGEVCAMLLEEDGGVVGLVEGIYGIGNLMLGGVCCC